MKKILIVGSGYVGLVTGACFAEMGHSVICLDIDAEKITGLQNGIIPIFEPGLEELVRRNKEAGRLSFTTSYQQGVRDSFLCFIAVSTPPSEDGSADLSYVKKAAASIAEFMEEEKIVINKSTVPVGTADVVADTIKAVLASRGRSIDYHVVSNPEFLKEGDAINDFMKPDRIVIGTESHYVAGIMRELYAPFNLNHERLILMDTASAEMTKYASNAMLASRISFMNEMALICEKVGADVSMVRRGMGSDRRIGYDFLYAGCGYGGSCFPKDIKALCALGRELEVETPLIDAIEEVNAKQKELIGKKIIDYFAERGGLSGKVIAVWGLAFKPGTDDIREAPALVLIRQLLEQGAFVRLFDPVAMKNGKSLFKKSPQIEFCKDEFDASRGADAIALMTEWKQFRLVDFTRIVPELKGRAFFDGRNQYHPAEMAQHGFDYFSIGQPIAYALVPTGV